MVPRTCLIRELGPGMILQQEVRTHAGVLLVTKGQEITYPLILRLRNFADKQAISDKVLVLVPRAAAVSMSSGTGD